MSTSQSKRSSGTFTRVLFGSIVQKGKFSAGIAQFVRALYSVDLPTFGIPTMPTFKLDENRPNDHGPRGSSSTSFFFGGMCFLRAAGFFLFCVRSDDESLFLSTTLFLFTDISSSFSLVSLSCVCCYCCCCCCCCCCCSCSRRLCR